MPRRHPGRCIRPACVVRRLLLPFLAFWILALIAFMSFDNRQFQPYSDKAVLPSPVSFSTSKIKRQKAVSSSTTPIPETIDSFVDRTSLCDRITRRIVSVDNLNKSVADACQRWHEAQNAYFRLRAQKVNDFRSRLLITGEGICTSRTFMVIIIHSLHTNDQRREAIRATWGSAAMRGTWPQTLANFTTNSQALEVRVAFIFGRLMKTRHAEHRLQMENEHYGDIIQADFDESYRNMTLKSLTGLDWVIRYCPSARFLFKCDDDMFINVPAILRLVQTGNFTSSITGPYNEGSRVYRKGKWALTPKDYPFRYFPPYESGSGYLISADLIRPLLNASDYVPYIFIDDVYITGILGRILGIRHIRKHGFAYWTNKPPSTCSILNGTVLTGTRVDPKRQYSIWRDLSKGVDCQSRTHRPK